MLEASSDFRNWLPEGELITEGGSAVHLIASGVAPHRFFRLEPKVEDLGGNPDGAEIYGYDRIFRQELSKAGFLTPEEFAERHKLGADYLRTTFEPTTANLGRFQRSAVIKDHRFAG
jgi:hypothetical protein